MFAAIAFFIASQASVPATPAEPAPAIKAWTDQAPTPPIVTRAGIAVPRLAGSLKLAQLGNLDGQGLDNIAQYVSPDEAISGSIFTYYPTPR